MFKTARFFYVTGLYGCIPGQNTFIYQTGIIGNTSRKYYAQYTHFEVKELVGEMLLGHYI